MEFRPEFTSKAADAGVQLASQFTNFGLQLALQPTDSGVQLAAQVGIVNLYNACGYPEGVGDAVRYGVDPRVIYRHVVAMNARGQVRIPVKQATHSG